MSEVSVVNAGAVQQIVGAESEQQMLFARKFPRNEAKAKELIIRDTCASLEIAASMSYRIEREDKKKKEVKEIIGPSVRFAEICAIRWGNLRVGSRIIGEDENFVTVQGIAWDLESNLMQSKERRGGIRANWGRYSNDGIEKVANGQSSKAYREAILKTIPQSFWKPLWDQTRSYVANADPAQLAALRDKGLEVFTKRKVPLEKILAYFNRATVDEMDYQDIIELQAIFNQVKDGEITIAQAFDTGRAEEEASVSTSEKVQTIIDKAKKQQAAEPAKNGADNEGKAKESSNAPGSGVQG